MLNYLISFFSKEIYIKMNKNEFIFYNGKNKLELQTKVFLSNNETIIAGVGSYDGDEYVSCISLFDNKGTHKFEMLERYFRFAIEKIHTRKSFIRPKIVIKNTKELRYFLNGYEEFIIKEALLKAGAISVFFEDSQNKYKLDS